MAEALERINNLETVLGIDDEIKTDKSIETFSLENYYNRNTP